MMLSGWSRYPVSTLLMVGLESFKALIKCFLLVEICLVFIKSWSFV